MDIDVEVAAGHGYPQVHEGVGALGEDVSVGRLDGLLDRGALHQAVVDEEDEVGPLCARKTRGRGRIKIPRGVKLGVYTLRQREEGVKTPSGHRHVSYNKRMVQ